jgi:hypothetical protein
MLIAFSVVAAAVEEETEDESINDMATVDSERCRWETKLLCLAEEGPNEEGDGLERPLDAGEDAGSVRWKEEDLSGVASYRTSIDAAAAAEREGERYGTTV